MKKKESFHWADQAAERVIKTKGNKHKYTCAAGITPSGTIHIGNFREIITVDLVSRALKDKGKETRFIYSWDDYDRFRKIPKNMPNQELLKKFLGYPVVDTPDTFGCHKSYAEHLEKELEKSLPPVGIKPEFIYQNKMYRACKYSKEIKHVLNNREKIRVILNKYRKELLPKSWFPLGIYCEKCNTDNAKMIGYDGEYTVKYKCSCGYESKVDFRKKGIVKLPWRIDWPMRWHYEKVYFEPGGKDHSTIGGSYDTAKLIIKALYNEETPLYVMYDFIRIKGKGGKISSSSGDVVNLAEVLEVYEPEIVRFLFAGSRPNAEFAISFDLDVIKIYEDFDRLEQKYYHKKADQKEKRIYELSSVKLRKSQPKRVGFRHLSTLIQIYEGDIKKLGGNKDIQKRALCVKNWLEKYAPEDFKFKLNSKVNKDKLNNKQKEALRELFNSLEKKKFNEQTLFQEFYDICNRVGIQNTEFFKGAYLALISKERGPKLAVFILSISQKRVANLLRQI